MDRYVLKYIVILEDENGEFIEQAGGRDAIFDTEEEALEFLKDIEEEEFE